MIQPVPEQPILFQNADAIEPCCPVSGWNHQYFTTDPIAFQFLVNRAADAVNLVTNPNFATDGTGWTDSGVVYNIGGQGAWLQNDGSYVEQSTITGFDLNDWFELRIDVNIIGPNLSGGLIRVTGITETIEFFANTGTYSFYVQPIDTSETIRITAIETDVNALIFIQGVNIWEIAFPTITTEDLDGVTLNTITGFSYDPPFLGVIYLPDSQEIAAGCFRFKVVLGTETFTSEPISLIPANICDILVGGCSQNTMYSPVSELYFRAKGKVLADQAPEYERFTTTTSLGLRRLNYGRKSKVYTLTIFRVPEHVRDFIYSFGIFNDIAIKRGNGEQKNYFLIDEPDAPEFTSGDDELATITLRLVDKQSLNESVFINECNFVLPPKALGSRSGDFAYQVGVDTAIKVP